MKEIIAKKRFGQNFLIDKNILNIILENVNSKINDLIIEIGPGTGLLTEQLKKTGSFLLCYEIDNTLDEFLNKYKDEKTTIKYEDFLKSDLEQDLNNYKYNNVSLIANIPYYITTPIIKKIIDSKINFKEIILMVQKEVGEKLSSKVGDKNYSSLSVFVNYFFEIKPIILVNKNSFYPIPKVDSIIIKLNQIKRRKIPKNYTFFEKIVKNSFQFRRKTLQNNLKNYNLNLVKKYLEENGKNLSYRPQDISVDEYVEISDILLEQEL